jgi:hypothetical protein
VTRSWTEIEPFFLSYLWCVIGELQGQKGRETGGKTWQPLTSRRHRAAVVLTPSTGPVWHQNRSEVGCRPALCVLACLRAARRRKQEADGRVHRCDLVGWIRIRRGIMTIVSGRGKRSRVAIVVIAVSRHLGRLVRQYTIRPLRLAGWLGFFSLLLIQLVLPTTSQSTYTPIPWVFGYHRVVFIHLEQLDEPVPLNAPTRCHNRFAEPT